MDNLQDIIQTLKSYDGRPIKVMEVCGTHTSAIFKSGIRGLLSEKIRLVSGPGCPVCLACEGYIDRLCTLALLKDTIVASFGDLFKVKGTKMSLADARASGGNVALVYSPLDTVKIARENPDKTVVMAAVGFETTAPLYALLIRSCIEQRIENIKVLTALKLLPPALSLLCAEDIDAFLAPGHVAAIIGSDAFIPLAQTFCKPFAVAGFTPENILMALYYLLRQTELNAHCVCNVYGEAVTASGNEKALSILQTFFEPGNAYWRGLSEIESSGLYLKAEYQRFDAGSRGLKDDESETKICRCAQVLTGKIDPEECPLFASACTPQNAYGPCMVSAEGACGIWYREGSHC